MKPVVWMAAVALASWAVAAAMVDPRTRFEIFCGMAGPLAGAAATWVLAVTAYRRDPGSLTGAMVAGFGVKLLLFAAYFTVMLKGLALRPVPFVASFTGYFITLHLMEALFLRRLLK
jgi:F0F1-type ATP synthase assembly protein I